MARYLPRDYEPIPDALLWIGADLVDVTRRIARNQNWIWANHGNVIAACGREPTTTQGPPTVTGVGAVDAAYFACPARSATGSDSVRVAGYASTTGSGTLDFRVRLYQLLPGETAPTADTPYDEGVFTAAQAEVGFSFTARIRSGSNPLRFCLRLVGATSGSLSLLSVTVTWARNPTSVLGETVAAWNALSQSYVQPDRPADADLWRAISNQTLRLMAENPRPIYTHSFLWPRIPTNVLNGPTRVALYTARHDGLSPPTLMNRMRGLVAGQAAQVTYRLIINGTTYGTIAHNQVNGPVDGVYLDDFFMSTGSAVSVPTGDLKIEVTAECTVAATAPPVYSQNVGGVLLGITLHQNVRTASDLGLPGADTVPATYQPLDDNACAPGRPIVAQDDRLGRRAGPYYLVKNLIWLAANRTAHVLVADWLHTTQSAALAGTGTGAGDGLYRDETLWELAAIPTLRFYPFQEDRVPFADRANPTDYKSISNGGHHFRGDVVGRWYCQPMNGGKIAMILRPDVLYAPSANGAALGVSSSCDLFPFYNTTPASTSLDARPGAVVGGFQSQGPLYIRPTAGQALSLRAMAPDRARSRSGGMQLALNAAYIYEAPLSQHDLDVLA